MRHHLTRPVTRRLAGLAALLAAVYGLPYTVGDYTIHIIDVALIFSILAVGMGLVMGLGGQINLAQIAFFGVASYATAILTTRYGFGFWTAAVLAMLAVALAGLVVAIPALRIQSHYLGIVTLGLALGFINWTTNAGLAGGAEGISGIPVPPLFGIDLGSEYLYYYLEAVVFAFGLAFGLFVARTSLGRRLKAMRDDDLAAGAVGAEIGLLRMTAFLLASAYGGMAGVLYAGLIRYVAPETFNIANMFLLLAMIVIGGRQSLVGCVVGAVGLTLIREQLIDYATFAQLGFGLIVVLMVVFAPSGVAGVPERVRHAIRGRRGATARRPVLGPFQPPGSRAPEAGPANAAPILEIREVSKYFRGLTALKSVSLTVRTGEIRGIVGPNGSGKTTLFNIVSGFYRPSAGRVVVAGDDVTAARPHRLSRAGVARTFQNLRMFGEMTVTDNLKVAADRTRTWSSWRYALWPVGVWRREHRLTVRARELLEAFGLTDFGAAKPGALPYGIQRRVELARAMATAPRLLLLDEPAAGLNGEEVARLGEIIRALRDSGVTVVLIEHNMGLVMSLCERVTVLSGGTVIAEGTPAEVAASPAVIEAYLGDSLMAETPLPDDTETRP